MLVADFFTFRRMIAPAIIEIIWWISTIAALIYGGALLLDERFVEGLLFVVLGPLIVRVISELNIVAFRIYGTLGEIAENTRSVAADRPTAD
jgi:hypothetical protein